MARTKHKLHFFDLWPPSVTLTFDIVMGLVRDMPTHHYKHFVQVIWKSNNNFRSYSTDKSDGHRHACTHERIQKLQIVVTMSRLPQAGSTKTIVCRETV